MRLLLCLVFLHVVMVTGAFAIDEMTVYELLAPDSHQFAIRYDVAAEIPGSEFYFNIIRPGSEPSDEKVLEAATGKELKFVMTTAKEAKAFNQGDPEDKEDTKYIKVFLQHPVPENGEYRLRILKTYRDAKSYFSKENRIIFDRNLSVKRDEVIFPKGFQIVKSSVPVIVTTESDGRVKLSMVNDRQDELLVHIEAEKLANIPEKLGSATPITEQAETPDQPEFFHRAEDDREITYWMLAPETHQFKFSHDFNIVRPGQKFAHSFVRKGSTVSNDVVFIDLDTGKHLKTSTVTGKEVNALGYYPEKSDDDDVVVQGELSQPVPEGGSVRIRVMETYTDDARYYIDKNGELVWNRTFGRPRNILTLPPNWMITSCSVPAEVDQDKEGKVQLILNNPRNDELHVIVRARRK
ncbi:MAG: hypothetical protein C5B54_06965 [Acidobacteria bacterium]|nr:MAG: hypothetical protein C5B54_06965 [Acidobacteriota bacterium]